MAEQTAETTTTQAAAAAETAAPQQEAKPAETANLSNAETIDKIVQVRVDKAMAKMGKEKAALSAELENLKREKLSGEELRQLELAEKEKELAEREKALKDNQNRLHAIKAIKNIGLDDGSENALNLVDFVMADDEGAIDEKVRAFSELVKSFVKAEVDRVFKANGRSPNGGSAGGGKDSSPEDDNTLAKTLGKRRSERSAQSKSILSHYLGGTNK